MYFKSKGGIGLTECLTRTRSVKISNPTKGSGSIPWARKLTLIA